MRELEKSTSSVFYDNILKTGYFFLHLSVAMICYGENGA